MKKILTSMIKLKFYLISFLLSLFFINSFGQAHVSGYEVDLQEKTPQSPNASSLGKYFDIPVNMATGIPNISIPLYTIKSGNIVVPMSLNYHAGGIQVNEIGSFVGLGWSLNAGGSVVKKTNGLDDDYLCIRAGGQLQSYVAPAYSTMGYNMGYTNMNDAINGLVTNTSYSALDSFDHFFSHVAKGYIDAEADEYNYSIPGGSGKFYYNQKKEKYQTSGINGTIVTGDGIGWYLTTNDGKIYEFGREERTVNPSFLRQLSNQQYLYSANHLTNINDPATGKDVHFSYDNYSKNNVQMGLNEVRDYNYTSGPPYFYANNFDDNFRSGDNYVLGSISFDKGYINFIKDTATRPDFGPNALKEILIFNNDNILIKKFNFDYFYSSSRLFLKSVQEVEYENSNTLTLPAYKFTYDTAVHLPARLSYAQDKWGYYNGKTSNWTSIPSHPLASQFPIFTLADRRVDSNYSKAGMLNGIVHPTGGKTAFEFENNRIIIDSLVGGLRIRKITHYDSAAQKSIITEYKYQIPSGYSSGGIGMPVFSYELFHISGTPQIWYADYIIRTESTPVNSLFPNQGSPIFYYRVEKKEKSLNGDLLSVHYFQQFYGEGEIYTNAMSVPHKKELEINDIHETSSEIYKKDMNNTYTLIQKKSSVFDVIASTQNAIWNTQAAWQFGGFGLVECPGYDPVTVYPMAGWISPSLNAYKIMPCANVETEEYSSTYANGNTLTLPSFSQYDSTNGNLKVSKTVDSKGDTTIRMMKYACEYIAAASPTVNNEIKSLIDQNMKAAPIEIITLFKKKNTAVSTVQNAELYEYVNLKIKKVYRLYDQIPFNSFTISYNDVNGFYKDSHYILEQEITAWDAEGRPRTVISKTNKTSYTWDEKYDQPTAIVANASYEDVAYTSFEGQSNGSWTVNSTSRTNSYYITGKQCYQLSNGSISKTGLNSTTTYVLSYWSRNGSNNSFTVSGSSSVTQGRTANGWTYYEHVVNNSSSVIVSGSGYIDELRIYPKGSLMSSNTYEPLRGITSQCDANNRISYYIYDAFSRLVLIRDQDNNILKKICYNYAGQPENCATNCTNFTPNWQNTTSALRCQLGICGNTGYQEQEQRDMNPCSLSFDSTRWVTTIYNPTACPLGTCVNLTSTNTYNTQGYVASYYNTATTITYTFNVSTASGLQALGTIPAGNYTLTISRPVLGNIYSTFKSGCFKQTITDYSAVFYNVAVSTATCNSITTTMNVDP